MNYKIIAEAVFFGSSIGLGAIVFRKIPLLVTLPEKEIPSKKFLSVISEKAKRINPFKGLYLNKFLQTVLTKVRILSLKTDAKTFDWLKKVRENSQKKKITENEDYWDEVKRATKR